MPSLSNTLLTTAFTALLTLLHPGAAHADTPSPHAATRSAAEVYNWAGPVRSTPDWDGIVRDELYFLTYQFAVIGALYVMPESISGWTEEQKNNYSLEKWQANVRNPVWDHDKWYINYLLHPYWGATYYIRAKERGLDNMQAFWFSFLTSAVYEFGAEAMFEPASKTDLLITPIFGALLAETVFMPLRERARTRTALGWQEKTVLTLTDPLGVLFGMTDHALGMETRYQFGPLPMRMADTPSGHPHQTPVRTDLKPVWGLQWQARF